MTKYIENIHSDNRLEKELKVTFKKRGFKGDELENDFNLYKEKHVNKIGSVVQSWMKFDGYKIIDNKNNIAVIFYTGSSLDEL